MATRPNTSLYLVHSYTLIPTPEGITGTCRLTGIAPTLEEARETARHTANRLPVVTRTTRANARKALKQAQQNRDTILAALNQDK